VKLTLPSPASLMAGVGRRSTARSTPSATAAASPPQAGRTRENGTPRFEVARGACWCIHLRWTGSLVARYADRSSSPVRVWMTCGPSMSVARAGAGWPSRAVWIDGPWQPGEPRASSGPRGQAGLVTGFSFHFVFPFILFTYLYAIL
jgi:hypothetical protein